MEREESGEAACFLLLEGRKRELVTTKELNKLLQEGEKLTQKRVTGIQFFDPSSDRTDVLYSVSVDLLGKGNYEVQVSCVLSREREELRDKQLELRLARLAKEVLRIVEQRCKAVVVRLELLYVRDYRGGLKLVGTEEAQLRSLNSTLISHSKSCLHSLNLPPSGLSHPIALPKQGSDAKSRPFSSLLRSRIRSRPRAQATPSPESLVVSAVKTCPSTDRLQMIRSRTSVRVRGQAAIRSTMVDQETQAEGDASRLARQPTRQQSRECRREVVVSNISMNLPETSWADSLIQDPFVRLSFHRDRKLSRGGSSSVSLTEPSDADRAKSIKKGLRTGLASRNPASLPSYPS